MKKATPVPEVRISYTTSDTTGNKVIHCEIYWNGEGIDRPVSYIIVLLDNPRYRKIAERFQKAVADGAVYHNIRIVKDVNQKTYVEAETPQYMCVMGKYLNTDLKKLGY